MFLKGRLCHAIFATAAMLGVPNLFAGTQGPVQQPPSYFLTLSLGVLWENAGLTQDVLLNSQDTNAYIADNFYHAVFAGELFFGLNRSFTSLLQSQFGIAIADTGDARLSGVIWDNGSPLFDNYTYLYKVQHTYLGVKEKLLFATDWFLIPWISGSVGLGLNRAYSFSNTPTIPEAVAFSNFTSHINSSFSYTAGAGVQKQLNPKWQLGIGYEFSDWGPSNLGPGIGQTSNGGLKLPHLYTNGFYVNFTYLA